ncbi:MAG TPA: CHRD domain-containing protein [Nitrososphaeraceae archaeon]|nr:CHRD domain-containing protein [Nitrososphaeraceae archaeon]
MKNVTATKLVFAIITLVVISGTTIITTQVLGIKFAATMSGDQVSPPTDTSVNGNASFRTTTHDTVIKYKIKVAGSSDVTSADIHLGKKGENGEAVVDLLKDSKKNGIKLGTSIRGNINSSDLKGPLKGKMIAELISAMSNGSTYVNIDTPYHENGEIRGQIDLLRNVNSAKLK